MRIAILFMVIIALGCNAPTKQDDAPTRTEKEMMIQAVDEWNATYSRDTMLIHQQQEVMRIQNDVIIMQRDSINWLLKADCIQIKRERDSLRSVLRVQNFKIGRIQYYVNICNRKPSQDKFLRGWINRTLK